MVGVGSPFSDDTLGWQLLDGLEVRGLCLPAWEVTFSKADRPGPGLIERIGGGDAAVVLDAMQSGREPGSLCLVDPEELEAAGRTFSVHALGVADALALGRQLGLLPAPVHVVGIEMGAGLRTDSVKRAAGLIEGLLES